MMMTNVKCSPVCPKSRVIESEANVYWRKLYCLKIYVKIIITANQIISLKVF